MYKKQKFTFSVAPMMDWTDRHCRVFHRLLSRRALLYTEMVVADAVIHGDKDYLIGFDPTEHPVALQIGGSDPDKLVKASKIGQDYGYDEININIGCPSDRVQSGRFGACLMQEPELVAKCFSAMQAAVDIPVTVKCRLGVDDQNIDQTLPHFIETVKNAGCKHVIIHARKAWLAGLSPKENRDVPPLDYACVARMKTEFPDLEIVLNGGLKTLDAWDAVKAEHDGATRLDGVMFGRAAYQTPWLLSQVDHRIFGEVDNAPNRDDVVEKLMEYASDFEATGKRARALTRHIIGLYHGTPGARIWRRTLSEQAANDLPTAQVIALALKALRETQVPE